MLCCAGLFVGFAVGSALGGPWTFIAPAAGFGLGLIGDIKLMGSFHGGHESHGGYGGGCHGGGHMENEKTEWKVKDPVCGMEVDGKAASIKTEFNGNTYYFCSSNCESAFKESPERYVK